MNLRYKVKASSLVFFILLFLNQVAYSQCNLRPIDLQERIQQSSLILEGMVVDQQSLWDDRHHNIYTIYTVDVLSVFKGQPADTLVHIVTIGGTVGLDMHVVSHPLELNAGKTGVFTLIPTNDPVSASYPLYEAYAGPQGFIKYEKASRTATGIFDKYSSIETDLYGKIKAHTHTHHRNKSIPWNKVNDQSYSPNAHTHEDHQELHIDMNSRLMGDTMSATVSSPISASATITSFSPTTITAGTFTQLTINGTGFGATQGSSYVAFPNADNGGSSYITPIASHYISWSDTKIVVEVPTAAGTGKIKVSDGTNTVTAATNLTVDYAILNLSYAPSGTTYDYRANHVNRNTTGGYTFQMYTGFDANTSAKTDFQNLVYQWRCATGINWIFGSTTTNNTTSGDGENVIRFDIGSELSAGVLGLATSRFKGCIIGSTAYWYVDEVDVQVDDGTNFFYGSTGSPSISQYDFYSVMLHEMGHAHQLGHIIDNTKVMNYSLTNGTQRRTISTSELTGASWQLSQSIAAGTTCTQTVHVDYTCTPSVTLSTGASSISETSGSTTVTATLSKRCFSDVTVTLGLTGTATTTTDYTLATSILIPSGSLSASITLSSVSDTKYEGNETVIIDITGLSVGSESGTQQETVTITDDDTAPTVTLSTGTSSIVETSGSTTVTATVSAVSGLATTVNLSFGGTAITATDYTLGTSIVIPAGSTSASITLASVSDLLYEGNETVIIDINTVTNGTESGVQQQTVTITDDDTAPTVTLSTGTSSIAETSGSTTVTATVSAVSGLATTVNLSFGGTAITATDYTLATSIVIPAGSTNASIALASVSDLLYEGNETVIIDINTVTNGTESGSQQKTVTITDDDTAPTVTLSTGTSSVAENGGTTTVTATLSAVSGLATTVNLAFSGTATVTTDYTLATSIVVPAGSTFASITLTSVMDVLIEGDETVIIDINTITNGTESGVQQKTVTILDNPLPQVTLSAGATSIAETSGSTTITATLSASYVADVTVNLSFSGTATVTSDYTLGTSIVIPAGSTSASITLASVSDLLYEGNETVIIDINTVTNGTESGVQQKTVTITDDDTAPTVTLSTGTSSIAETSGSTTVTATVSAVSGLATTVNLSFGGTAITATDYTLATSIVIPAGSTSASITLASVSDLLYEGNETVIIDINTVTNGTESGVQQQTVTITDDDTAPSVTLSTGTSSIAETSGSTTVTATVSAVSGLATTVNLSFGGTAITATDYTLATSIVIPAGSTSASITLASVSDLLYEGNETVIIDINTVTNGTESGTQQQTVTITDDDTAPTVTLSTGTSSIVETSGSTTVTATVSAVSGLATTVNLSFSGTAITTTDYTLGTPIVIPAGSTSASITLASVSDLLYEGNETVIIDINTVTNGTESGTQQKTVTITDDDTAPTVTLSTGTSSIAETSGSTTVTATISAVSGLATTVNLSFSGTAITTTDYTLGTSIVIPAGSTSASITLASVSDLLYEGNETVIIDINTITNGTESGTQQQTVTITDDDSAPSVILAATPVSIAENGGTSTITATLSGISGLDATIGLSYSGTATDGADYTSIAQIVVPAGSTSASVIITSLDDLLDDDNETIIVDANATSNVVENTAQQVTITIIDDENPEINVKVSIQSIANNGTFDYGNITVGNNSVATFTIENLGTGQLNLTGTNLVALTGTNASDYTLDFSSLSASIAPGANSTFTLTFLSDCGADRLAQITIGNNDSDEGTYVVNISASPVETVAPVADVTTLADITSQCAVTLTAPTATDNCSGAITATTSDPVTYSQVGTYTVTWTYTDQSGNTSSQQQQVIIQADVTAPQISCPADVVSNTQTVTYTMPTATDNCSTPSLSLAAGLASGSVFPHGNTTVTYTATDLAGNTTSCSFTVTVNQTATATVDATEASFRMYPNPSTDYVVMENIPYSEAMNVYDNRGILMMSKTNVEGKETISLTGWTQGVYMVQLISGNKVSTHKLEVIK